MIYEGIFAVVCCKRCASKEEITLSGNLSLEDQFLVAQQGRRGSGERVREPLKFFSRETTWHALGSPCLTPFSGAYDSH